MNEQILSLANKANKDIGYTFKMEEAKQLHELMEKFAELIVKECFRVAVQKEDGDTSDYNSGRSWAGIDILKHFGVEE
jgi:hypothetical protein